VFHLGGIPDNGLSLHLVARPDGGAGGMAGITDGTSNTIMVAEKVQAIACGDLNLDGFAGVTHLLLTLTDARSGAVVPLTLVPVDGEIDSVLEGLVISVGGLTFEETVTIGVGNVDTTRGLGYRFVVTANAGEVDLGSWTNVSGLEVTMDVIDYRPAGGTITLHRAAGSESLLVKEWLQKLAQTPDRPDLEISLLDSAGETIATWTFAEVFPTKWSIAGFEGSESVVAMETLVIAYDDVSVRTERPWPTHGLR
jgi:hypothetical protein